MWSLAEERTVSTKEEPAATASSDSLLQQSTFQNASLGQESRPQEPGIWRESAGLGTTSHRLFPVIAVIVVLQNQPTVRNLSSVFSGIFLFFCSIRLINGSLMFLENFVVRLVCMVADILDDCVAQGGIAGEIAVRGACSTLTRKCPVNTKQGRTLSPLPGTRKIVGKTFWNLIGDEEKEIMLQHSLMFNAWYWCRYYRKNLRCSFRRCMHQKRIWCCDFWKWRLWKNSEIWSRWVFYGSRVSKFWSCYWNFWVCNRRYLYQPKRVIPIMNQGVAEFCHCFLASIRILSVEQLHSTHLMPLLLD